MKLFVGNLSDEVSEDELRSAFEKYGPVESVTITREKDAGQPKGLGVVEMASDAGGQSAMDGLNGKELKGSALTVNQALSRAERRDARGGAGGSTGGFRPGQRGYGGSKGGPAGSPRGYAGGGGGVQGRGRGAQRGR